MWETFGTAIALVLVIEGLLPFLSPQRWREVFSQALRLNDGQLRFFGLVAIVMGLVLLMVFAP
jgi:uncharacterized protein YjeT (DUF2065 family)